MKLLTSLDLLKNELLNARIQNLASDPASAVEGQVYHNTVDHKLKFYNGTSWEYVGSVVTDPATGDGKITIDGVEYTVYTMPTASTSTLGGVKVGSGLAIDGNGALSTESIEWSDVLNKPSLIEGGTLTYNVSSIAQLKTVINTALTNGELVDGRIYHGTVLSQVGLIETYKDLELTLYVVNNRPIVFLSMMENATTTRIWAFYAVIPTGADAFDDNVYELTHILTTEELESLNVVIDANYVHTDNNFTTQLLNKLNNIEGNAQVNVRSNWMESDPNSDAFIENKPVALSSFTNDEGFIDNTVNNLTNYYKKSETYTQSEVNSLLGQLATIQITSVDTLPTTGSSNVIYLIPKTGGSAPNAKDEYLWTGTAFEKIGDTQIDLTNYVQLSQLAAVATSGSYTDLTNTPREYVVLTTIINSGDTIGFIETNYAPICIKANDAITGETVIVDSVYVSAQTPNGVRVSIASVYSNPIAIMATCPVNA